MSNNCKENTWTLLYLTIHITLLSDSFACQQAVQCSLLSYFPMSPTILVQSTAVNITSLLTIFRKAAEDVFLWIAEMCQT